MLSRREILKLMGSVSVGLFFPTALHAGRDRYEHIGKLTCANLLPIPKKISIGRGNPIILDSLKSIKIKYKSNSNVILPIKQFLGLLKTLKLDYSVEIVQSTRSYFMVELSKAAINDKVRHDFQAYYTEIQGKNQGYFVDIKQDAIYVGANDKDGLAYGIYTLIDLIDRSTSPPKIPIMTVIDYPDFYYRAPTYLYTLQAALSKNPNYAGKIKEYLNFLAMKKVNAGFWPRATITGDWKLNEKWHYREINEHALNNGIKLFIKSQFDLNVSGRDKGVKNTRVCMGSEAFSGYCYADDMVAKKSEILAAFCKKYKPGGISFHTIDFDPHKWKGKPGWWEYRCEACRNKYKDDERWKADRDQINNFYSTIKSVSPATEIIVVLWPYHPRMLTGDWNLFPGSEKGYKEYLLKVTAEIPKDIWITTRECTPNQLDTWVKHINGHPIAWWIYPGRRNHWIYTSMAGMATWFKEGYKMALFWNDSGLWFQYELSNIAAQQFMWNTRTKGFQVYQSTKEMYETWRKEDIAYKPETIIKDLMPKIAKNIYGDAAPYILKALKTNVERNDPYQPKDTAEPGWRYSRFEYDIDGKIPSQVDGKLYDPVKTFTTIKDEAREMFMAMNEAIKHLPDDNLRRFVILCLYEKSRQLYARAEGFYNWMLASQVLKKDEKEKILNYIVSSAAYFETEEFLMIEAEKKDFPPETTTMFGYVPIYWKPIQKLHTWCKQNDIRFPSDIDIKAAQKHMRF